MDLEKPKVDDHEAKMARADLYKLAEYSIKLFKMIGENDELDGWVQAKITKASDYISSVYHYLEYENMSKPTINDGPKDFEESKMQKIKNNLSETWKNEYKKG